jgi:hypothetical protein
VTVPETPNDREVRWVWMRSVDDWPLATNSCQMSGGKPASVAVETLAGVFDVTDAWCPPFEDRMSQSRGRGPFVWPAERASGADRSLKNFSVGAIGWPIQGRSPPSRERRSRSRVGARLLGGPPPSRGAPC